MEWRHALDIIIDCYNSAKPLSQVFSKNEIIDCVLNGSSEIRAWIAKVLVLENNCNDTLAIDLLCKLAADTDNLVRVEAVDSLSVFPNRSSFSALCDALSDTDKLVRAYAAFGVAVVGKVIFPIKAVNRLLVQAKKETDNRVFVGIYEGLYILGYKEYLLHLIDLFQNKDYHIKCAVIHALEEILDDTNYNEILSFCKRVKSNAYPISVKEAMNHLICITAERNQNEAK